MLSVLIAWEKLCFKSVVEVASLSVSSRSWSGLEEDWKSSDERLRMPNVLNRCCGTARKSYRIMFRGSNWGEKKYLYNPFSSLSISHPLSFPPLSFLSFLLFSRILPCSSLRLEVASLKSSRWSGARCKFLQWVPVQSLAANAFLAIKRKKRLSRQNEMVNAYQLYKNIWIESLNNICTICSIDDPAGGFRLSNNRQR